jgi:hypothetical protein
MTQQKAGNKPDGSSNTLGCGLFLLFILYATYKFVVIPWDMTPSQKNAYFERQERIGDGGAYYPGKPVGR